MGFGKKLRSFGRSIEDKFKEVGSGVDDLMHLDIRNGPEEIYKGLTGLAHRSVFAPYYALTTDEQRSDVHDKLHDVERPIRPYAGTIAGTVGSIFFGPWAGAAIKTGVDAGMARYQHQRNPDEYANISWRDVGKQAAINFATAAAAQAISKLVTPKTGGASSSSTSQMGQGFRQATQGAADTAAPTMSSGFNAATTTAASNAAAPTMSGGFNAAFGNAVNNGIQAAPTARFDLGQATIKAAREAAPKVGSSLTEQALTNSLTPSQGVALSDISAPTSGSLFEQAFTGSALDRFGQDFKAYDPKASGPAITEDELNTMLQRADLQGEAWKADIMDRFSVAQPGSFGRSSALDEQLGNIAKSMEAEKESLINETNLFNEYAGIKNLNNLSDADMEYLIRNKHPLFTQFAPMLNNIVLNNPSLQGMIA